jgi:glutathione synthase/RimK-type ligase-like ATP-grasp enzyme
VRPGAPVRARGRAAAVRKLGRAAKLRIALASYADEAHGVIPAGDWALRRAWEAWGHSVSQVRWNAADVRWRKFDFVAIRSCWDYHLQPEAFLNWIARIENDGIPMVNPAELIRWNLDKRYLGELGLTMPETIWLREGEVRDLAETCAARGWPRAVVKPLVSASAYQTSLRADGIAAGPAIVQEFLPEIQTQGEWSLLFFGGLLSHAVRKFPAAGDFRVQSEFGGSHAALPPPGELTAFARRVLERMPVPAALARVDLVQCARRGPLLMELEVIDPELFFPPGGTAHEVAARAVLQYVQRSPSR